MPFAGTVDRDMGMLPDVPGRLPGNPSVSRWERGQLPMIEVGPGGHLTFAGSSDQYPIGLALETFLAFVMTPIPAFRHLHRTNVGSVGTRVRLVIASVDRRYHPAQPPSCSTPGKRRPHPPLVTQWCIARVPPLPPPRPLRVLLRAVFRLLPEVGQTL